MLNLSTINYIFSKYPPPIPQRIQLHPLEGSLSITTLRCDLAIATHARKMHK